MRQTGCQVNIVDTHFLSLKGSGSLSKSFSTNREIKLFIIWQSFTNRWATGRKPKCKLFFTFFNQQLVAKVSHPSEYQNKGWSQNNLIDLILFSLYLGSKGSDLQKCCVYPSKYPPPLVMCDRHKNVIVRFYLIIVWLYLVSITVGKSNMEVDLILFVMEDNLIFILELTTIYVFQMEDDPILFSK